MHFHNNESYDRMLGVYFELEIFVPCIDVNFANTEYAEKGKSLSIKDIQLFPTNNNNSEFKKLKLYLKSGKFAPYL